MRRGWAGMWVLALGAAVLATGACVEDMPNGATQTRGLAVRQGNERVVFLFHNATAQTDLSARLAASYNENTGMTEWDRIHLPLDALPPADAPTPVARDVGSLGSGFRIVRRTLWHDYATPAGGREYVTVTMSAANSSLTGNVLLWSPTAAATNPRYVIADDGRTWAVGFDVRFRGTVRFKGQAVPVDNRLVSGGTFHRVDQ